MSNFIDELVAEDAPVEREVEVGGQTGMVWFRRISGGEREKLLAGMKINHVPGTEDGTVEIDMGDNEHQKHLLVMFAVCTEDGRRVFKTLDAVRKIPFWKMNVLLEHANAVNKDLDEMPGKD